MSGELVGQSIEALPPLSWIVVLPERGGRFELLHGTAVELFRDGFFEGAWDGDFAERGFAGSSNVFGSGAKLGPEGITFVGPSHTLEPLYVAKTDRLTAVSNSLPFLLHHCGMTFDPRNASYGPAFAAIVEGLGHTPIEIAMQGGRLTILHHHNASFGTNSNLQIAPKPLPPDFARYDDYVAYLRATMERTFRNAADPARRCRYRPIATISSGYDSGATTVIAGSCGCTETIGLATSNRSNPDSGRATAEALGLSYSQYAGMPRAAGAIQSEAEFLAPGMQGEDLYFSAFEEALRGRVVTTGVHGGVMWNKARAPSPNLSSADGSGCSLGEFRLRCNFVHLPMAFIGAQRWPDISRISNAPEMADYSIGGGYDRPIPRRILEEAGVPRGTFGQAKNAASILLFQERNRMSRAARASVAAYSRRERIYLRYLVDFFPKSLWWLIGRNLYRVFQQVGRRMQEGDRRQALASVRNRICAALFGIKPPIYGASHPRYTILLTWALSEIEGRYAAAGRYPWAPGRDEPPAIRLSTEPIPGTVPAHRDGHAT
jgi:hypothetical protein